MKSKGLLPNHVECWSQTSAPRIAWSVAVRQSLRPGDRLRNAAFVGPLRKCETDIRGRGEIVFWLPWDLERGPFLRACPQYILLMRLLRCTKSKCHEVRCVPQFTAHKPTNSVLVGSLMADEWPQRPNSLSSCKCVEFTVKAAAGRNRPSSPAHPGYATKSGSSRLLSSICDPMLRQDRVDGSKSSTVYNACTFITLFAMCIVAVDAQIVLNGQSTD